MDYDHSTLDENNLVNLVH